MVFCAPWLMEILSGELGEELAPIAERIVGVAAGTSDRRDDMTVALIRITELPLTEESTLTAPDGDGQSVSLSGEAQARELEVEPIV